LGYRPRNGEEDRKVKKTQKKIVQNKYTLLGFMNWRREEKAGPVGARTRRVKRKKITTRADKGVKRRGRHYHVKRRAGSQPVGICSGTDATKGLFLFGFMWPHAPQNL